MSETQQYALFMFEPFEACGGVDDLYMIGTLEQCIETAEKSSPSKSSHIAQLPSLKVVQRGEWHYTRHPLVGHEGTYSYEWTKDA